MNMSCHCIVQTKWFTQLHRSHVVIFETCLIKFEVTSPRPGFSGRPIIYPGFSKLIVIYIIIKWIIHRISVIRVDSVLIPRCASVGS